MDSRQTTWRTCWRARPRLAERFFGATLYGPVRCGSDGLPTPNSLHSGVGYGRYDWHRLVHTTVALPQTQEEGGPRIGVEEGGWHAAEGLIIARYLMFTQVYFHKTRVIYDYHLQEALADLLPGGSFPKPTDKELENYLQWDDWQVLGLLADGKGGEGGRRLADRK